VPDRSTADAAVFLPGRNVLLVAKTAVWCSLHSITTLAVGHLQSNPFADATGSFFEDLSRIMTTALDTPLRIIRPLAHLSKSEVLRIAAGLPLELTFSCIAPAEAGAGQRIHCGRCNKCEERQYGFRQAGIPDPTAYASSLQVLSNNA
jgi:7-cyano-7-deazaguanine synthase